MKIKDILNKSNHILLQNNIDESFLQYYDINSDINTNIIVNTFDTSTSRTSVLKFDLSIGLVPYE